MAAPKKSDTDAIDRLFEEIIEAVLKTQLPSIEDSNKLDIIASAYWEGNYKDLSLKGVRVRPKKSIYHSLSSGDVLNIITHFVHQKWPEEELLDQFILLLKAYRAKEINASTLFGRRPFKPRLGHSTNVIGFMQDFIDACRLHKRLSGKLLFKSDSSFLKGNVFKLCADLAENCINGKNNLKEILNEHDLKHDDEFKRLSNALCAEISFLKELNHPDHNYRVMLSFDSWREASRSN